MLFRSTAVSRHGEPVSGQTALVEVVALEKAMEVDVPQSVAVGQLYLEDCDASGDSACDFASSAEGCEGCEDSRDLVPESTSTVTESEGCETDPATANLIKDSLSHPASASIGARDAKAVAAVVGLDRGLAGARRVVQVRSRAAVSEAIAPSTADVRVIKCGPHLGSEVSPP